MSHQNHNNNYNYNQNYQQPFDNRSYNNVNQSRRNNNYNNNNPKRGKYSNQHNNGFQHYNNNDNFNYQHGNQQNYSTPVHSRKRSEPEPSNSTTATPSSIVSQAKASGKTLTDLLYGDVSYYLQSPELIKKFKNQNCKWPKELNLIKTQ